LIAGEVIRLELADDVKVKAVNAYTIVGSRCRVPICRRRPPANSSMFTTCAYLASPRARGTAALRRRRCRRFCRHQPDRGRRGLGSRYSGLVAIVRIADFVGVIAEREENAVRRRRNSK